MNEEEKKAIEQLKKIKKAIDDKYIKAKNSKSIDVILNLINKQQEQIEEYEKTLDIFDNREYRKKYLEEERAKRPKLLYPDADEIYQRYYEQKSELEKKDKIIDKIRNYIEISKRKNILGDTFLHIYNDEINYLLNILKKK